VTSSGESLPDLPENGLLGAITQLNPDVLFLSTGGTFALLQQAALNVMEVAEYTQFPEMNTGLVKSLHPRIHAGILAHVHTDDDAAFLHEHQIRPIDAVIVNFYPLAAMRQQADATVEMLRQTIDIGGPTMSHNARKAWISTALLTDPQEYPAFLNDLHAHHGAVSIAMRLSLVQQASTRITGYMAEVDTYVQSLTLADIEQMYEIVRVS
jgi:phosphoribosylaminoimidazolecarboxamide formyltransferase/IMP cyclohydrolase